MKSILPTLLAALLSAAAPVMAADQSTPEPKPTAKAPTAKKPAKSKHTARQSPKQAEAIKQSEEQDPIDEPDPTIKLDDAQLAIAKRVFVGELPCELGASVHIRALRREGFFLVRVKQTRFVMHPVESKTGAIRLEDPERGALWLQLGNKSMLMSQKLGQRLADECQSPEQKTFAEELKKHPINILEPAAARASAAASAANPPGKSGPN
ncbi:MAG TPA: hypothetical protein VHA82_19990 [Ramlibacter sp.]|uniref:hypothetical protein n=1 Tax=Ramlibacter sp. TaxID=1917967 RepID=UPI002B523621|nr:hypothetical protein [Ramlibacter sp.]HVZ46100.1 hypothetical protein [Ramlibacter sp.]